MIQLEFDEVVAATGARMLAGPRRALCRGVSTDSRSLSRSQLFVALDGPSFDGNRFAEQAVERGAAGLILRAGGPLPERCSVPTAVVRVPRRALADLARWQRARLQGAVVAITGSCGKTTTKELLSQLLAEHCRTAASRASFNNDVGVPHTLLETPLDTDVLIVEMGTSGPGEIAGLCRTAHPTAGILTNIGPAHLAGLGSLEGVAREKGALAAALPSDGFLVLNVDCPWTASMRARSAARAITFGLDTAADVWASDIWFHAAGTTFKLHAPGLKESPEVSVPLLGLHMVQNLLAALAACHGLGVPLESVLPLVSSLAGARRRMERREGAGLVVLDDSYNANPASTRAGVRVLAGMHGHRRRILVLGDMLELGAEAPELHHAMGRAAAEAGIEKVVAVGRHAQYTLEGARQAGMCGGSVVQFEGLEEALDGMPALVASGDVLLVKASRGARLERLVEALLEGREVAVDAGLGTSPVS